MHGMHGWEDIHRVRTFNELHFTLKGVEKINASSSLHFALKQTIAKYCFGAILSTLLNNFLDDFFPTQILKCININYFPTVASCCLFH